MKEELLSTDPAVAVKPTADLRKEADRITAINTGVAVGAGLIPLPALDAAAVLGVQINMIRLISGVYHVEFRENIAKSIVGSLAGSIAAFSIVKAIPVVGTVLGSLALSISSGASTYALGKVFTQHFDQGGTLLNFDPVKSREFFAKEFEAGRIYASKVAGEAKEAVSGKADGAEKEKSGFFSNLFDGRKKNQEKTERLQMMETSKDLQASVAHLKKEVASLKKH